ncbi:MAG: heat-inducible transcription repressor HrcA [Clostridia bacterium]|nr:heat-inducible transcription repressor HrcA [Clostridia bacterium]
MANDRQKLILKALIDMYIDTAEPVGSKALAERLGLGLSSATLRNEMAALIEEGYLEQPHTSAGRIPTHKGYRLYVNELMNAYSLTREDVSELNSALKLRISEYDRKLAEVGQILSELTRYASVTMTPKLASVEALRRIEIVPCDPTSCVVILVTGVGTVKNKLCRFFEPMPTAGLSELVAALNAELSGIEPRNVTFMQVRRLEAVAGEDFRELLAAVLEFLKEIAVDADELEVSLSGAGRLLAYPEYRDIDRARELLEFLGASHGSELLSNRGDSPIVIQIGDENTLPQLKGSSLVLASCKMHGGNTGYVGIVGPTRMDYSRIAARLSFFAKGLSAGMEDMINTDDSEKDD